MSIYLVNTGLTFLALFLLCVAIGADWSRIRPAWRAVLIMGTVQQAVLAYGSIEAYRSDVPVQLRQVLFLLSLIGLVLASFFALVRAETDDHTEPE